MSGGWIGVDLDGTIAEYHGWFGVTHIGKPVPAMVDRVRAWVAMGTTVKIFTARVSVPAGKLRDEIIEEIQDWLEVECGLPRLEVTNVKDFGMIQLYDDRAVQVRANTGQLVE